MRIETILPWNKGSLKAQKGIHALLQRSEVADPENASG